jgi:aryl-alcohol dehydrogenase-like predicted oxidoreductase
MKRNKITRRRFLKNSAIAGAAVSLPSTWMCSSEKSPFNSKGLPTRMLGKTGVKVPLMTIGTGSRFMSAESDDVRMEILTYGLDHGLFYWDTASIYKQQGSDNYSEEILGEILKDRRKEVFLASKVSDRDPELVKQTIENSLARLQTDYIDLYQVHSIESVEDAKNIGATGGLLEVLHKYKSEGVIRHIGFTGHRSAEGMKYAAGSYDFETMIIAMNHWTQWEGDPEKQAIPAAAENGLGIIAMKVIRPMDTIDNLDPEKLIRYALSIENISTAVIGIDNLDVLKANIEIIRNFEPLPADEMTEMRMALTPYYQHKGLDWMKPGYVDGYHA